MTGSAERSRNARGQRTATALLAATRELVDRHGFAALTMGAVAERAGVSRRAVYLHFATRTELVAALYRSLGESENLADSLATVWDAPDSVTALDRWAKHIARSHPRILATLRAIENARRTDADAAELWRTTMDNWHASCQRLAGWLRKDGRLAAGWSPDGAADMLWALMSLDMIERLMRDLDWSPDRFAKHYGRLLRSTFVRD